MIKAIPTNYNGIQFRSRLEAKWAVFFDLCGWQWQYEPFDMPGWIPDFILRGHYNVLIEVKPYSGANLNTWRNAIEKAETAWKKCHKEVDADSLLLLGDGPFLNDGNGAIGQLSESSVSGYAGPPLSFPEDGLWFEPAITGRCWETGVIDFCHDLGSYRYRMSGHYCGSFPDADPKIITSLWAKASNTVQWMAKP